MMRTLIVLLLLGQALAGQAAIAHEMSMAELNLREMAPGEFLWQWSASDKRSPTEELTPIWPKSCRADGNALHCGEAGLKGSFEVQGVGKRFSAALVKVFWLDGQSRVYTLTAGQPTVQLFGSATDQRSLGEVASAYTGLGIEHILTGIDHQLFVIGLLFLVGFNRKLLWTITAFTVAHSLTLACSALGLLTLHSAPVEATIALSIVLVAGEALHREQTLARRFPALVAFLFGLVHGLGFAGALEEIGLPAQHLPTALFSFNVGVEIGQLFTVAVAWGLWYATRYWPRLAQARTATVYGIGIVAAYWSWERAAAIFS
jgi:hydrogenase/urease accessory protein HupE